MSFSETTLLTLAEKSDVTKLLTQYVDAPHDPYINFVLGFAYDNIGQTAAAVSFYLRAAEKSSDDDLRYEALIRCANCFDTQGSRTYTTRGLLQHAVSLLPRRPEAYYLMSRFHQRNDEWKESYMMASIGLGVADSQCSALLTNVGYPGAYVTRFQLAISSWWVGLCDQTRILLRDLRDNYDMDEEHIRLVDFNLKNVGCQVEHSRYSRNISGRLRFPFPGVEHIEDNFSQSYQDMFVLAMLNGKRRGSYVEIGCGDPFTNNNTALLEETFAWKGISLDYDRGCTDAFFDKRKNTVFCLDATQTDYNTLFSISVLKNDIDYLQLDCDPPEVTLEILYKIPFDKYRFAVITYEHDHYRSEATRQASRDYLESQGYVLAVSNIGFNHTDAYEDWWVHPDLVDPEILERMKHISDETAFAEDYMLLPIS